MSSARAFLLAAFALASAGLAHGCSRPTGFCVSSDDCGTGQFCSDVSRRCEAGSGAVDMATADLAPSPGFVLHEPSAGLGAQVASLGVAVGDIDGDRELDVVASNSRLGNDALTSVTVMFGTGGGGLKTLPSPGSTFTSGPQPYGLLLADLNGDTRPELIVPNFSGSTLTVFPAWEKGVFPSPTSITLGGSPVLAIASEFNGDGIPDVAVSTYSGNSVVVLAGNGSGGLTLQTSFNTALALPRGLAAADFNGDKRTDIAVSCFATHYIVVFLNTPTGFLYGGLAMLPGGSGPQELVTADFNADTKADLAVANYTSGTVGVMLGRGDGSFAPPAIVPLGINPVSVVAADFNRDQKQDLAITLSGAGSVGVLLGRGDGTFQTPVLVPIGPLPFSLAMGDMDRDGKPDLVVSQAGGDLVSVLLNRY